MAIQQGRTGGVQSFDRVPPQALDAETSVLGAILVEGDSIARVIELIPSEAFYRDAHRLIYAAMLNLYEKSEVIDVITLSAEMEHLGSLEKAGGRFYLASLMDHVATAAHVTYHANLVKEKWIRRRLIRTGTEIVQKSYDDSDEVEVLLDGAEQSIFEISEQRLSQGFFRVRPVVKDVFKQVQELHKGGTGALGLSSGFRDLDTKLSGLQGGDLLIIAGRPSMGKTAFALNITSNIAVHQGKQVGFFSLEMSKEQLVHRLLCSEARADSHALRNGFVPKNKWKDLIDASNRIASAPIFIDDSATLNVLEMRAKARRLQAEHGLSVLVVDYLQLAHGGGQENRQQEISHISRSLKALAKELRIPVIALSQLSRAVENRAESKRPMLSDLRESGAIEQDADVVLFVYREEMYKKNDPSVEGKAEIIIGKQRNGPLGTVNLSFIKSETRFADFHPGDMIGDQIADDFDADSDTEYIGE